jgi:hypothetical protein
MSLARLLFVLILASLPAGLAHAEIRAPNPAPAKEVAPDAAGADAVVLRALQAGLDNAFDKYLAEVAPDRCESQEQRSQLQRYEFKRFAAQASWYVSDAKKPAPQITQRQPQNDKKIKLFLKDIHNKDAMPRPIELSWKDGRWWITANSL